jgi:hypothetical protein
MDDFYLKEAIGAVKTYAKMINDHATEDGNGKEIIDNKWYYYIEAEMFIITLIINGEKKIIKFFKDEWKHPKSNMLGNPKLECLVKELIKK